MLARTEPPAPRVVVVGAGMGGLSAALLLAHRGLRVTVVEKEAATGGKLRQVRVADRAVDSGPTVLTMRDVFDAILDAVGARLDDHLTLDSCATLARHHWTDGTRLDLYADPGRSADAIAAFAGPAEADAYLRFCRTTAEVFETLRTSFIEAEFPSIARLVRAAGVSGLPRLARIRSLSSLWRVVSEHFRDPRLRQLFGRYATYCGSSPFEAPGPLMLVAHVEQAGVWQVREGMHAIARLFETLARARGAEFVCGSAVERIEARQGRVSGVVLADGTRLACDAVVFNGDPTALSTGLLGPDARDATAPIPRSMRSLSALTLSMAARAEGFPLAHHNVFFSADYAAEFDAIRRGEIPPDPTVYLCAQDRGHAADPGTQAPERLFTIVNAPADGDVARPTQREIERCVATTFERLAAAGLTIAPSGVAVTSPADFNGLFPATGGALYGRASHGWLASFQRPTTITRLRGLYLAGGAVHPGPGLPMAALSGRNAARAIIRDLGLPAPSGRTAMPGGTSTR